MKKIVIDVKILKQLFVSIKLRDYIGTYLPHSHAITTKSGQVLLLVLDWTLDFQDFSRSVTAFLVP